MFNMLPLHYKRLNLQAFLLSTMLIASVFTAIAPAMVESQNLVTPTVAQKLMAGLAKSIGSFSSETLNLVIQTTNNPVVIKEIKELGGEVSQVYSSVEAFAASLPADKVLDLAENPSVSKIFEDTTRTISEGQTNSIKLDYDLGPFREDKIIVGEDVEFNPVDVKIGDVAPNTYAVPDLTDADETWGETSYGAGGTVAIIDTGCWVDPWTDPDTGYMYFPWYTFPDLTTNVFDGIDLSYDVGTSWEGYGVPTNHYHGTGVAGFIANHVELIFGPGHSWGESFLLYYPDGGYKDASGYIHLFVYGVAPLASIYAVKVFDHTGGGVPSSIVMAGMDHVIQLKLSGTYDIHVMSMSLGGGVGAPGEDPSDLLVDAATEAGILVSAAAGNEGPAPMTVGSPGTGKTAITSGGAADPIHERAYGNIALWNYGIPGWYFWPHDEFGLYGYTSKGPTADGRQKPDVISTASSLLFSLTPAWAKWYYGVPYTLGLGSGTSFSCPQTSGLAALLVTYGMIHGYNYDPLHLKTALIEGANPLPDFTEIEQGAGYINAVNSLAVLETLPETLPPETYPWSHHINGFWFPPVDITHLDDGIAVFNDVTLDPAKYAYFYFRLDKEVDSIKITITDVQLSDWNPVFGDSYNVYLTTSARGGVGDYYFGDPQYFYSNSMLIVSLDTDFQPGVVRLVLENDFSSFGAITFGEIKVEVTEAWLLGIGKKAFIFNRGIPIPEAQIQVYEGEIDYYYGTIKEGDTVTYTINIPDPTGLAIVLLSWVHDWNKWPTNDLDMYVFGPYGSFDWAGATAASPESTIIDAASTGTGDYTILIEGYQVYFGRPELYVLKIIYLEDPSMPLWSSEVFSVDCVAWAKSPVMGIAIAWIHDLDFDYWYIGGFAELMRGPFGLKGCMGFSSYTK